MVATTHQGQGSGDLILRHTRIMDPSFFASTALSQPLAVESWPVETDCDIVMRAGKIEKIIPNQSASAAMDQADPSGALASIPVLDVCGRVTLPAFIDAHMHLDKAYTFGLRPNLSGTLQEAIEIFHSFAGELTRQNYYERADRVVQQALQAGTTCIRTHIDCGDSVGLTSLEALLDLREHWSSVVDIQIVLLSGGLLGDRCRRIRELYAESLAMGADIVGGCPGLAEYGPSHIDVVFELAQRFDRPVDLHIDEADDPCRLDLEYLAEKTRVLGWGGRVTAGHCCSLASVPHDVASRVIAKVAAAGVQVVTLPACNLYLQGRQDTFPSRRGITRVKELLAAGVNVACASDNVQDAFNPFGKADPVLVAYLLALGAHMGGVADQLEILRMWTSRAAQLVGQSDGYGLMPGARANLVVLDSPSVADIIAQQPGRFAVISNGRLVAGSASMDA